MKYRLAASVALAALVFAACGGETATNEIASLDSTTLPSSDTTVPTEEVSMEDGLIAFTECLRENGVDIDDPTVGPDGNLQMGAIMIEGEPGSEEDMDAKFRAMDAVFGECEPLLGQVAFTNDELPDFSEMEDAFVEYAACMRDNGVDMPDPDFSGGDGMINLMIDATDSNFEEADEACRDILAMLGPGSSVSVGSDG